MSKWKVFSYVIAISSLFVWVFAAITIFIERSTEIELLDRGGDLVVAAENSVEIINLTFLETKNLLSLGSDTIVANGSYQNQEELTRVLQDVKHRGGFLSASLDFPDGTSYTNFGEQNTITDAGFLAQMDKSGDIVSNTFFDSEFNENVITISVPLEGIPETVYLTGRLSTQALTKSLNRTMLTPDEYYFLLDETMNYVTGISHKLALFPEKSFLASMESVTLLPYYSKEVIMDDFLNQTEGFFRYHFENKFRYAYYMPVGINDWMFYFVIQEEAIYDVSAQHNKNALVFAGNIALIIIVFGCIIMYELIKIHGRSRKIHLSLEALAFETKKVIVEWNPSKCTVKPISNFGSLFGDEFENNNFFSCKCCLKYIHPEDIEKITAVFKKAESGENSSNESLRVRHSDGNYIHCAISSAILNKKGSARVKIIGFLENVDETTKLTSKLRKIAERDPLTNLYNKGHTEFLIREDLQKEDFTRAALFIVDLDNFKQINDTFGHIKGDEVLKNATSMFRHIFRHSDVIGRIGGDEFFVYISDYENTDIVELKAKILNEKLRKTYVVDNVSVEISCSIGIALSPEAGRDYKTLYNCADKALYAVKEAGKNGYKVYSE